MKNSLVSLAAYIIANGVGLLLAVLLIDGFSVAFTAFVFAVLLFCIVQAVAEPLVKKLSRDYAPQVMGGISLVVIFFGLMITGAIISGMTIGGIANLLAATLLVWLGSLLAQFGLKALGFAPTVETAKKKKSA